MRRKGLLVMVVLGLMLWPAVLYAGAQAATAGGVLTTFNPQEKLTDQQLTEATGLGIEKPRPCEDGKIILWDEWNRARPTPVVNAGNQGQVIICSPQR
jgi:hypothetical protein